MNTGLENRINQNQQLTLTPKMVEELNVLQMPYIDLLQYIDMKLDENPLLETEDNESEDFELSNEEDTEENEFEEWEQKKDFTEYISSPVTLRQHLLLQIGELNISPETRKIIFYLIETINDEGYLGTSIDEASRILRVSLQEVRKALGVVQKLEPEGVGARNLKECILLQLNRKRQLNDSIKIVVTNYLEQLAQKKYKSISERVGISLEQVAAIHQKIKSTDPKPGLKYHTNTTSEYIQPELAAKLIDGKFIVLFKNESPLNLRVGERYKKLIKNEENAGETKRFIRTYVTKAMEFINAIEQRKRTVLNVAGCIIEYQEDFLRKGHMFLRPLTLKMVADKVGLHESTISRTINNKYIETSRGVFELKFFFSSQIDTCNDACIAANAVKKAITLIIQNENKNDPLSDEQIRGVLQQDGVRVARRTVTKYREELSLLPARMRRIQFPF